MTKNDKLEFCSSVQLEPRELIQTFPDASTKSYGTQNWILILSQDSVDVLKPDEEYPGGKLEINIPFASQFYKKVNSFFIESESKGHDGKKRIDLIEFKLVE